MILQPSLFGGDNVVDVAKKLLITSVIPTHPLGRGVGGRKKDGQSLGSKCHYPPPTFMNSSLKGILEYLKA